MGNKTIDISSIEIKKTMESTNSVFMLWWVNNYLYKDFSNFKVKNALSGEILMHTKFAGAIKIAQNLTFFLTVPN